MIQQCEIVQVIKRHQRVGERTRRDIRRNRSMHSGTKYEINGREAWIPSPSRAVFHSSFASEGMRQG